MFGMSDDKGLASEDEENEDEELSRNIVASAIHEGGGGGAFASPSNSKVGYLDAEKLGLLGSDTAELDAVSRRSSPHLGPAEPPRLMSPLIAQLNPFAQPPSLDLPPAALCSPALPPSAQSEADRDLCSNAGMEPTRLAFPASPDGCASPSSPPAPCLLSRERSDVQHLLVEMGGLVCQLQQREDLAITTQEVRPEVMLERLDHFREVARSAGLLRKNS